MRYRIDFNRMNWESPMEGVRSKTDREGHRQIRLVEYTRDMAPHWCTKGHWGVILDGEFEIEFPSGTYTYAKGDGVLIPPGEAHRHRARALTERVAALFVEDI